MKWEHLNSMIKCMKWKSKVRREVIHKFPDRKMQITYKVKKFKYFISNTRWHMDIDHYM